MCCTVLCCAVLCCQLFCHLPIWSSWVPGAEFICPLLSAAALPLQGAGVLEGFQLFMKYDYIKGIFAMSCLFMVEVTILDYTMKVNAALAFLCGRA